MCKDSERHVILSLLSQIGWRARIQSIITEIDLIEWYERALTGKFSNQLGDKLIHTFGEEIKNEFPFAENSDFIQFYEERGYHFIEDDNWKVEQNTFD